jgi:alpha-tubulin suppressor-like RCC1 family protein
MDSFRGMKVDAVAANLNHTIARAEDGSVYVWGDSSGLDALGLGPLVSDANEPVRTPQRVAGLRLACGP